MPELPEVETVVRTLEHALSEETIRNIDFRVPQLLESGSLPIEVLLGKSWSTFKRRGKYLIFGFEDNLWLVVHLRMEGKFNLYAKGLEPLPTKHTHVIITTDQTVIHYMDTRKFSRFAVIHDLELYLQSKKLGYEPFDSALNATILQQRFSNRKRSIKTILLDQTIIAGIGNIYADEILFESKINPLRSAQSLSKRECDKIISNTRIILKQAIRAGGTTIRSYTSSLDVSGRFQFDLNAYGRKGQQCRRCKTILVGQKLDGRSTVWCPKCQRG